MDLISEFELIDSDDDKLMKCRHCGGSYHSSDELIRHLYSVIDKLGKANHEDQFIASECRDVFHRPSCKWVKYINEDNKLRFHSHAEAAKDRKPCKTCRS